MEKTLPELKKYVGDGRHILHDPYPKNKFHLPYKVEEWIHANALRDYLKTYTKQNLSLQLDYRDVQPDGDITISEKFGVELKSNPAALKSHGKLSLEILNTKKMEYSGILGAFHSGVKYVSYWLPHTTALVVEDGKEAYADCILMAEIRALLEYIRTKKQLDVQNIFNSNPDRMNSMSVKLPLEEVFGDEMEEIWRHKFYEPYEVLQNKYPLPEEHFHIFGKEKGDSFFKTSAE